MATMTVGTIPSVGAAAALASSFFPSCPSSSSYSCCGSSFRSQTRKRDHVPSDKLASSSSSSAAAAATIFLAVRFGFATNSGLQRVGGVNNLGHRRGRSRMQQICAGTREPGSDEPGSSEPGPSGTNGENKDGDSNEEEDLDLQARFRLLTTDWRAFRARLVKGANSSSDSRTDEDPRRWAHALVEPEKGCLLIAHPTAFGSRQTYFNQAVIFIFEHGEDGSAGFILNRPTSYALGQVPGFGKFMPEFIESSLYMGGDVGTNSIQVIHGIPGLHDSKEVISGVYLGGPDAINNSVKRGETVPNDYRWFLGYCGWRPGQLEREVAHGVWYLASGSRDIVTNQCIRLKRPLWRQVLELMGGEYSLISKRAYGEI
ncbi:unnamed protein product [Calypogeia fissa]